MAFRSTWHSGMPQSENGGSHFLKVYTISQWCHQRGTSVLIADPLGDTTCQYKNIYPLSPKAHVSLPLKKKMHSIHLQESTNLNSACISQWSSPQVSCETQGNTVMLNPELKGFCSTLFFFIHKHSFPFSPHTHPYLND